MVSCPNRQAACMSYFLQLIARCKCPQNEVLTVKDGNALFLPSARCPTQLQIHLHLFGDPEQLQSNLCQTVCVAWKVTITVLLSALILIVNVLVIVLEHQKRGKSKKLIVEEPLTKKQQYWKKFPLNEKSKQQLIKMM